MYRLPSHPGSSGGEHGSIRAKGEVGQIRADLPLSEKHSTCCPSSDTAWELRAVRPPHLPVSAASALTDCSGEGRFEERLCLLGLKNTAVMARSSKRKRKKWQARLGGPGPRGRQSSMAAELAALTQKVGLGTSLAFPLLSAKRMTALSIQA